ncbi:hypothetical protein COOONC_01554 [Cooperia oncophora]
MGRRKQAKPTKRTPDEFEIAEMEPSAKIARETLATPSATTTTTPPAQDDGELSPSCSKDPAPTDLSWTAESSVKKPPTNPLLMLEKSLKRFEPRKSQPGETFCLFLVSEQPN